MFYEALLAAALVLFAGVLFNGLHNLVSPPAAGWRLTGGARTVQQIYVATIMGLYFTWFWHRGQTLAMRAWKLRLVSVKGGSLPWQRALARYACTLLLLGGALVAALWLREHPRSAVAWALLLPGLVSVAWALFDPERQTLYDRITGAQLVRVS